VNRVIPSSRPRSRSSAIGLAIGADRKRSRPVMRIAYSSPVPMTLSPGDRLCPYEVVTLIGSAGMGEVYRARDRGLPDLGSLPAPAR
jgi:serine/threonine protein kinase